MRRVPLEQPRPFRVCREGSCLNARLPDSLFCSRHGKAVPPMSKVLGPALFLFVALALALVVLGAH